jgi:hypothetical protein
MSSYIWVRHVKAGFPGEKPGAQKPLGASKKIVRAAMNIEQREDLEEMVKDIHAKMIDSELMETYQLSATELKTVLNHLVDTKVLSKAELFRRPILADDSIDSEPRRHLLRHRLAFLVSIHEADSPENRGWVTDITDRGLGTAKIHATVGEVKPYVIVPRRMKDIDQIILKAECRWNSTEGPDQVPIAGFRITEISPDRLLQLRKFIRLITLGDEE